MFSKTTDYRINIHSDTHLIIYIRQTESHQRQTHKSCSKYTHTHTPTPEIRNQVKEMVNKSSNQPTGDCPKVQAVNRQLERVGGKLEEMDLIVEHNLSPLLLFANGINAFSF